MAQEVTLQELIESGAHYGHQKHRWNPKMKRFIFELRNGLYIIDLAKSLQQLRDALEVVKEVIGKHRTVLFVGTKKQAKGVIRECAESCGEFYICERWLGGMLTNLPTIRNSIKKLERIEKRLETGAEGLTKKEISCLNKDREKLDRNLSGIRTMRKPPGLVFVVDSNMEHLAVAEANKLGIPVMGLVDTNCDPDPIQHVIPCNDDALKSIRLMVQAICDAIVEKKTEMQVAALKGDAADEEEVEDEETAEEVVKAEKHPAPAKKEPKKRAAASVKDTKEAL